MLQCWDIISSLGHNGSSPANWAGDDPLPPSLPGKALPWFFLVAHVFLNILYYFVQLHNVQVELHNVQVE